MSAPTPVLVHGASGRMGRSLLRLLPDHPALALAAAVSPQPLGEAAHAVQWLPPARMGDAPAVRLVVDFSLPEAFDAALGFSVERGAAFVSGTTGLSREQHEALERAGQQIPVLWAANFSLGVAVLSRLVEQAARALPGWDLDIVESHHVHKKDAPSGTALALGAAAAAAGAQPRYASLRAGDIVGEHAVQFTGLGERIELVHRACDRDVFARGALAVGQWLAAEPPGLRTLGDWVDGRSGAGA